MAGLFLLLYGEPGTGKTPIGHTAPGPRLILDAEMGSKYITPAIGQVTWDPEREPIPEGAGETWDTCIVVARSWPRMKAALDILRSRKHPFKSVVLDSLTESQKRCRDVLEASSRNGEMTERLWGSLLRDMEELLRGLRDDAGDPDNPLENVIVLALLDDRAKMARPLIQGGLQRNVASLPDVMGLIYATVDDKGERITAVQLQGDETAVAKDRTSSLPNGGISGVYGDPMPSPIDLTEIITRVF